VNLLLDTHALLWWLNNDPELPPKARKAITDPLNIVMVSAVNVWEIVIKKAIGKLEAPDDLTSALQTSQFEILPIQIEHALQVGKLPSFHADPFDRMLVAQAMVESLTIVTHDNKIKKYGIPVLWN
jgi:PIN domain nuclease of toxin-antitoxin system